MRTTVAILAVTVCGFVFQSKAQIPEDALRLSMSNVSAGARAMGMGNAFTGIANDFTAIYWNPAGLGQMDKGEISFGMNYQKADNSSLYFGNELTSSQGATTVNSFGLSVPVPVKQGSLVLAFGFNRSALFNHPLSFSGFNPSSSIIQTSAPNGSPYPGDLSSNWAYQLYLADIDTLSGRFVSPITNRLTQSGKVTEGGGLNNWSAAGAIEAARNLFIGATLTFYSGTYTYDRSYMEEDLDGVYDTFPFDFERLTYNDYIDDDISGFGAKFGFLYRVPDFLRVGVTVKTPTGFHVRETFGTRASSYFDNGDVFPIDGPYSEEYSNEYDVTSPWVFSGGVSLTISWFIVSADLEFTDWSSMKFSNAPRGVLDNNALIRETFRGTLNYRLGGEFDIFGSGVRARAGIGINNSPYAEDPVSTPGDFFSRDANQRFFTAGLGIPLGGTAMFDLAYQSTWWNTYRYNYSLPSSRVDEELTTHMIVGTFAFRF